MTANRRRFRNKPDAESGIIAASLADEAMRRQCRDGSEKYAKALAKAGYYEAKAEKDNDHENA